MSKIRSLLSAGAAAVAMTLAASDASAYPFVSESGDTAASAHNVDGTFGTGYDNDIFNSTTVKHTSVQSAMDHGNDVDWFRFTLAAGSTLYLDIDGAAEGLDTVLSLFNSSFALVAMSDDSSPPDPGSSVELDSFLGVYTAATGGIYYAAVSRWDNYPAGLGGLPGECFYPPPFLDMMRPDGAGGGTICATPVATGGAFLGESEPDGSTHGYTLHISVQDPAAVPEPATLALLGLGLAGLGFRRRARR